MLRPTDYQASTDGAHGANLLLGTWASGIRPLIQQERSRSEMPHNKGRGEWILSVVQRQYIQGLLVALVMCAG